MKWRNFRWVLVALLVSGCATAPKSPAFKWAFQDELADGKRMIQSGNRRQAIDELSMLLDLHPKNDEARFLRAVAYQALEEFPQAIEDYETILQHNPRSFKAHYNLGMIFAFKTNDPKKALEHFDRFLSLAPGQLQSLPVAKIMCSIDRQGGLEEVNGEVNHLMDLKDPAERRSALTEMVRRNPDSPILYYLIGKTHEEEGQEEEAIRSYETALSLRPTCAPCHSALGKLLLRRNKAEEGKNHLAKAKLFDPNSSRDFEAERIPSEEKNLSGSN